MELRPLFRMESLRVMAAGSDGAGEGVCREFTHALGTDEYAPFGLASAARLPRDDDAAWWKLTILLLAEFKPELGA